LHVKHFKDFMEGEEEEEAFACKALQRFHGKRRRRSLCQFKGSLHLAHVKPTTDFP